MSWNVDFPISPRDQLNEGSRSIMIMDIVIEYRIQVIFVFKCIGRDCKLVAFIALSQRVLNFILRNRYVFHLIF